MKASRILLSLSLLMLIIFSGSGILSAQELYLVYLHSNPNKVKLPECDAKESPVVKQGTHTYTIRGWWTTDQTFCTDESKKIN